MGAGEAFCASVLLCLGLKGLDGVPQLGWIFPTGSGALLQNPSTRSTDTTTEFRVRESSLEVSINRLALMLQGLDLPCDLNPPLKQLVRVQVLQMGERILAFRRKGLEEVLQGTRG